MTKFKMLKGFTVICTFCLLVLVSAKFYVKGEDKLMTKTKESSVEDCWFQSSKGFNSVKPSVVKERQDRETYGYPADISLKEALNLFNKEQKCIYKGNDSVPDLTEDELLSAVAIPPDYGRAQDWQYQSEFFRLILREKKLPKGSLLVNEGGGIYNSIANSPGEIKVRGQRIYLFLGLDKAPRMSEPLKSEQVFLVKKTLFGLEDK